MKQTTKIMVALAAGAVVGTEAGILFAACKDGAAKKKNERLAHKPVNRRIEEDNEQVAMLHERLESELGRTK